MAPPPPKKVSVFIGRETLVDRDDVDKICHSIEHEAGALADAALGEWEEVTGKDGEARDSPVPEEQASRQGSSKSQELVSLVPLKRPRGRPRGRPRRTETPRRTEEARDFRRSSRIHSVAAPPTPAPASPKLRRRSAKKKAPAVATAAAAGKEWEIERIVDSRIEADTLRHFYLVKWRGFDAKHNTWEPKQNLDKCSDAIVAYEQSMGAGN